MGNLDARRDFTDVRDVVRAYRLILEGGRSSDVYSVCSNRAWRICDVVAMLIRQSRIKGIRLKHRRRMMRRYDNPVMMGDASNLRNDFGWKPEIPIEQTLRDVLGYWKKRVPERGSG